MKFNVCHITLFSISAESFEHMKKSGDYYVTVVEDVTLGQIVATATLIVEHKFIHSCAKVCVPNNAFELKWTDVS